jgi:phosphatidate cytidylyltransferase
MLASFGLITHRDTFGLTWMLWLVLVVAVTDIGGYFAGRIIGGPEILAPRQPEEDLVGHGGGLGRRGIVGWAFMAVTGMGVALIGISVALSMASQMGDIAESAVKRSAGVKDSSHLLPGMAASGTGSTACLGASLLLLVIESFTAFLPSQRRAT